MEHREELRLGTRNGLYRFDGVSVTARNPANWPTGISCIDSLFAPKEGGFSIGTLAGLTHWLKGKVSSISEPSTSVEAITEDSEGAVRIAPGASAAFTGPIRRVSDGIQTAVASSIALGSRKQYGAIANDCFFLTI